jgi:diguanylate cyclase (GGDEF)-like protein
MTQKKLDLIFDMDIPESNFALAVGKISSDHDFIFVNRIFSMVFPKVLNPNQLVSFSETKSDNKTILKYNEGLWELLTLKINPDFTLFLLKNISYEMLVLQQLKKKLKELTEANTFYNEIIDKNLPLGVMIIDDGYNVSYANDTAKRFFSIPPRIRLQKCFNYVQEIKPCVGCILNGFLKDKQKNKKTFETKEENRLITTEIHSGADNKYIIISRDTTKEINLIKEIKKQQEELEKANKMIADQNDILKRLSAINIKIGQVREQEAILEIVIHAIIDTFSCKKSAILLFNEAGKIKNAHFTGDIDESETEIIIKSIEINMAKPGRGSKQKVEAFNTDTIGENIKKKLADYTIQDMLHKEELIGRIFLYQPGKIIDQSILKLFLNQVSVYLESLELQQKLEEVAQTDALTGVFNRYYFEKQFKEEISLSQRFGQPLSLILIDLNGLKELNDEEGHEAGDLFLKEAAGFFQNNISSVDSIYRVGGDEFIILLSNCPENQLKIMVDMLSEIQSEAFFKYNGKRFPVSYCLGGACSAEVGHNRLKEEADRRMYMNKKMYYKTHDKYR